MIYLTAGGVRGRRACMAGGHAWQGSMCGGGGGMCGRRDGHGSGRYAFYWNAFLLRKGIK